MSTITVLIPTLNEEENIDPIIERIISIRQSSDLDLDILFVDSASTDGTCDRVRYWFEKAPVRLLQHNTRMSLSEAVIAGAHYTDAKYVLVMDADLSHPPELIPNLIQPLLENTHDMVIGSRYVTGGSIPDWPLIRAICSKLATFPAQLFCNMKDPLSGFFAVERKRLADLPDSVPGFKIGLAVLAEYRHNIRVTEIPIEFRDRHYGKSKMNYWIIFDYMKQLSQLAYKRVKNFLR